MKNKNLWTFFSWHSVSALLAVLTFLPAISYAQQEKKYIKEGNILFENKKYKEAEKSYQQALQKDKGSYKATFNLGDAYYKQGKYEDAAQQFQDLTHRATSADTLSKAYHNLGNALLKSKKYEESANAYKNALKNNPNDDETRYNLAYAQQMLKQQQEQQKKDKNKDKKDKDKKDKNKKDKNKNDDKDKQDKDKQDKDKEDQQKKNQQNKDQKDKKEQPDKISKEDAQRLLDALQNDEKNIQDKLKKGKQGIKVKIEKDW
jgi:Ca-activated chloride channel family protein